MSIYTGKGTQTPIYTTVQKEENLCYANSEDFFSSINLNTNYGSVYYTNNTSTEKLSLIHHPWSVVSPSSQKLYYFITLTAAVDIADLQLTITKPVGTGWKITTDTWTTRIYVDDTIKTTVSYSVTSESQSRTIDLSNISAGSTIGLMMNAGNSTDTTIYNNNRIGFNFTATRSYTENVITGYETTEGVKSINNIYIGKTGEVPVYTETTTTEDVALSTSTFTDFFSADSTGTTGTNAKGITWADNSGGGLKLTFGNYGIHSSTSMTTFTAQRDLTNVVISGLYYTETRYDKITLTVAGSTVLNAVSGTSSTLTQRWTGSLTKGQTIVLKYVKDNVGNATNESSTYFTLSCDSYQKTTTTQIQTGTETKLVDKKIVKGYVGGPDGKARLFFGSSVNVSYTGEYTVSDVTVNSVACKLYTLTGSGTLTVSGGAVQYWMCGGGASGNKYTYWSDIGGTNGGGGGYTSTGPLSAGNYIVTIGAGGSSASDGSATSIGDSLRANGGYASGNGGSGGGGGQPSTYSTAASYGSGEGVSTIPFGLSDLKAHCAGGGGGAYYSKSSKKETKCNGGKGGTNGGNGADKVLASYGNARGGTGGTYGGGNGGAYVSANNNHQATSATFYGSGGGGAYYHASSSTYNGTPGSGYQGVAYVLVPA